MIISRVSIIIDKLCTNYQFHVHLFSKTSLAAQRSEGFSATEN